MKHPLTLSLSISTYRELKRNSSCERINRWEKSLIIFTQVMNSKCMETKVTATSNSVRSDRGNGQMLLYGSNIGFFIWQQYWLVCSNVKSVRKKVFTSQKIVGNELVRRISCKFAIDIDIFHNSFLHNLQSNIH